MEDRRAARRFPMKLPLEVSIPSTGGPVSASARTRNLSYCGLYFTLERAMPPGSRIEFVLTLPKEITLASDVRVQCAGRVVRVEGPNGRRPEAGGPVGVAAVIEEYDFLPPPS